MSKLEDAFGIRKSTSLLPTHNIPVPDSSLKYVFQKALKTMVESIFLFLLNSKIRLENVVQDYRLTLPMHNDNSLYLSQGNYVSSTKERLVSAITTKFNTQEMLCLCLSVPLLIILGFLTILRPTFKAEENHYEENIMYNNSSPDLKYYIQNENDARIQENRFLMTNKLYSIRKSIAPNDESARNSVRYNVVGINSLRKVKSGENLLFTSALFQYQTET